jgi:hypothetical protein
MTFAASISVAWLEPRHLCGYPTTAWAKAEKTDGAKVDIVVVDHTRKLPGED